MPQNPPDTSGIERELFDLLGSLVDRPDQRIRVGSGNPSVSAPPPLAPNPVPVIGSEMLARLVQMYQKRLPWLGNYVSRVSNNPTPGTQGFTDEAGLPWNYFVGTNLRGATDMDTGEIAVNPRERIDQGMEAVLAHEIAHALGLREHDRKMANIQGLAQMRTDAIFGAR